MHSRDRRKCRPSSRRQHTVSRCQKLGGIQPVVHLGDFRETGDSLLSICDVARLPADEGGNDRSEYGREGGHDGPKRDKPPCVRQPRPRRCERIQHGTEAYGNDRREPWYLTRPTLATTPPATDQCSISRKYVSGSDRPRRSRKERPCPIYLWSNHPEESRVLAH